MPAGQKQGRDWGWRLLIRLAKHPGLILTVVAIIVVAGIVIAIVGAIKNSSPVVSLVGVIVQTLGFGGALIALAFTYRQVQGAQTQLHDTHLQNQNSATWQAMVHYQDQWVKLKHARGRAWNILVRAKELHSNVDLDQVINFLESLAYMTKLRSLNQEWVLFVFYSDAEKWLGHPRIAGYIEAEQEKERRTVWSKVLPWLDDLRRMEKRQAAARKPIALGEAAETAEPTKSAAAVKPTDPIDIIV